MSDQEAEPEEHLIKPRGPVVYDLKGQHDGDFDKLCFRLVRLEFPAVIKPSEVRDGGADALLPKEGGGYERAWQAKHYPDDIHWDKCQKSFRDAQKNYAPEHYTFCFPRDLTEREQKTFDRHFRNDKVPIPVDYWSGEELQTRLTSSPEGRVVAGHFFPDEADKLEAIKRAAIAKRPLDTPHDALQHLRPAGELLAGSDPYFSYSAAVYKEGGPEVPLAKDTVMSVLEIENGIVSRLDVVPDDDEALELFGPQGKMLLSSDVYREIGEALQRGESFTAKDIDVTWEQLPPAFSEDVGKTMRGEVTIGPTEPRPKPPKPWPAQITAIHDGERGQVSIDLQPVSAPEGWDACLEGTSAGLTMRMFFRRRGGSGQIGVRFNYSFGNEPARQQLKLLAFMDLTSKPGGTLRVVDRKDSGRTMTLKTGAPEDRGILDALTAFLENIVEIEDWAGVQIPVTREKFTNEYFQGVAMVAAAIRRGGFNVLLHQFEIVISPADLEKFRTGGPLMIQRDLEVMVLDKKIDFGLSKLELPQYHYEKLGDEGEGNIRIRVSPLGEAPAKMLEQITRPARSKRPPPPPRRKKRKRGGRRKGGRS